MACTKLPNNLTCIFMDSIFNSCNFFGDLYIVHLVMSLFIDLVMVCPYQSKLDQGGMQ